MLLAGGREWPAESGLGRVVATERRGHVEGRWRAADGYRYPKVVDGVGYADTIDGPLTLVHELPRGMHQCVAAGTALVLSVELSEFESCR